VKGDVVVGNGPRVIFVGKWSPAERGVLEAAARSVEEYLGAEFASPWRFEKGEGGYRVSQPALLLRRARAASLVEPARCMREAADFATPFTAAQ
jgi:hypothetical protein